MAESSTALAGERAKDPDERRSDRVSIALGSLLGVAVTALIALPRIGDAPLWLDEAYSVGVVNQFVYAVEKTGGTMVGYYALLWGWSRVSESPAWLRLLSVLFAWAAMPVIALLGRRIGGRRLAIIAPPLLGAAYMFQAVAIDARSYSAEILMVSVCWYVLLRAVEEGTDTSQSHRWWVAFTVLAPLGVLFHGLFVLFLAAMGVAALLSPRPRACLNQMLPAAGATVAVVLAMFWLGVSDVGSWVKGTPFEYVKHTLYLYVGWRRNLRVVIVPGLVILTLIVARRWWRLRHEPDAVDETARLANWRESIPIVWAVVPPVVLLAISMIRPEFIDRYFVAVTPGIALAVGLALCRLVDWIRTRARLDVRVGSTLFAVLSLAVVTSWGITTAREPTPGSRAHWDEIAELVASHAQAGDGILLYSDLSRPPFEAAWSRVRHPIVPSVINMRRQLGQVKRYDVKDPATHLAQKRVLAHDRVWTIGIGHLELGAAFYELTGSLPRYYHVQQSWTFDGLKAPVTVRLYVRDTANTRREPGS